MSTVTGYFVLASGDPYEGEVRFRPVRRLPIVHSPALVDAADVVVETEPTGNFCQALEPGDYEVWFGDSKQFRIAVPNDSSSHQILDLITTTLGSATQYHWGQLVVVPLATTTTPGVVVLSSNEGDEVVQTRGQALREFVPILANYTPVRCPDDGQIYGVQVRIENGVKRLVISDSPIL